MMAPRTLYDDAALSPLTEARGRQQGLDSPDSCPPPGFRAPPTATDTTQTRALLERVGRAGKRTRQALARGRSLPSRVDACNPLLQAHPTWARDKHEGRGISTSLSLRPPFSPFALRLAPTHLGWGTRRHFTRRPRDPPVLKHRQIPN
jgi:hypothetical protein